jgi:hypothetical protein
MESMKVLCSCSSEGENLDWQNSNGHLICNTTKADEVLKKIKPGTDNISIDVFEPNELLRKMSCKFIVYIYHHDCPTGSRMYFYSAKHRKDIN